MDLIEALEKTKIKYPDIKTVKDFAVVLNNSAQNNHNLINSANTKLELYLKINSENDHFQKFIDWLKSRIPSKPEYKKGRSAKSLGIKQVPMDEHWR
tara:strand:- start:199 stop:489 length:291 start_codon:yes stop_codon:yes gene_type:complete